MTFTAGPFDHYAVTFSAAPFYAGVPFTTYVTAQDTYNNPVTSGTYASGTVTFSSSSGNMPGTGNGMGLTG